MFNNKGGVGKTTLTCNLASYIKSKTNLRILVIDCDPQCNATQLILGVEAAASIYVEQGAGSPSTIKNVLQPIEDGDSSIDTNLNLIKSENNRFGIDLLPGHPGFAIIEDRLGYAWNMVRAKDKGGFRQTNWNSVLLDAVSNDYDLVFYDLGPSLGSINRSVLVGCDHFVTPIGSDVFSIIGVQNISKWLISWNNEYAHSWNALTPEEKDDLRTRFKVLPSPAVLNGFIGYTVQQYITKSYGKVRRATKAYEQIIGSVDQKVFDSLNKFYSPALKDDADKAKLGDIPHLYSLVPLAQKKAVPIHGLRSEDGLVGSQYASVTEYKRMIDPIANNLLRNLGLEANYD
jgi:cellulose biosynthesis protein BcsQ